MSDTKIPSQILNRFNQLKSRNKVVLASVVLLFMISIYAFTSSQIASFLDPNDDTCSDEEWIEHLPHVLGVCISQQLESMRNAGAATSAVGITWQNKVNDSVTIQYVDGVYQVSKVVKTLYTEVGKFDDPVLAGSGWLNQLDFEGELVFEVNYPLSLDTIIANLGNLPPELKAYYDADMLSNDQPPVVAVTENVTTKELTVRLLIDLSPKAANVTPLPYLTVKMFDKGKHLTGADYDRYAFLPAPVLDKIRQYGVVEV